MASNFPSSLDTLTNPSGSDTLDNPDHSAQHANANDILEAIEAKVGIDSSAVNSSHDRKLSGVTGSDKAASLTGTETLTNKTLTSPTLTSAVVATSLDMNGQKLILDANANTSITADTDDQIDIEISGADDFQFTANLFEALDGSDILVSNDDAFQSKQDGGTVKTLIKMNSSDQTEIGSNEVRATRFVPIDPPVAVVSAVNPGDTGWVDVDVTAQTSARAFMVTGNCGVQGSTLGRYMFMRKNGESTAQGILTRVAVVLSTTFTAP